MLEVETGSGVNHSFYESKETPENPWMKLHNELWDNNSGASQCHEPHEGSKRMCCTKNKVRNGTLSAFAKKYEKDAENQVESLPSFEFSKNACDDHLKMNVDHEHAKLEVKKSK